MFKKQDLIEQNFYLQQKIKDLEQTILELNAQIDKQEEKPKYFGQQK